MSAELWLCTVRDERAPRAVSFLEDPAWRCDAAGGHGTGAGLCQAIADTGRLSHAGLITGCRRDHDFRRTFTMIYYNRQSKHERV